MFQCSARFECMYCRVPICKFAIFNISAKFKKKLDFNFMQFMEAWKPFDSSFNKIINEARTTFI